MESLLKYLCEALRLRQEKSGAVSGDEEFIFKPDAEFAWNVYSRFIAERVPFADDQLVAADEVIPFVPIHSDPVSHAVREEFVVRAESARRNDFARRRIDILRLHTGLCGNERGVLRMSDD